MKSLTPGAVLASTLVVAMASNASSQVQGNGSASLTASSSAPALPYTLRGPSRVEDFLVSPLVRTDGQEAVVRGRGYKASLRDGQFTYAPVVGNQPDASVRLRLSSVTLGGEPLPLVQGGTPRDTGTQIELDHGTVVEAYAYGLETIEQTFRFDALPRGGDLVVTMELDTSLGMEQQGNELTFVNEIAEVTYSSAFVLDASGARVPIETASTPTSIALTVPSSFLAEAALPVTIDPVIGSFVFTGGVVDDSRPDAAYHRAQNRYVVVFQDYVNAADTDLYFFSVEADTGIIEFASFATLALDTGVVHQKPSIAVNDAADQLLVVAESQPSGGGIRQIDGFLMDSNPAAISGYDVGLGFPINDGPGLRDCFNADVAGNTFSSVNAWSYLVTWTREWTATDHDVHGQIVSSTGALTNGRINIDSSPSNDIQSSVSASIGDSSIDGNYYNVVWIRDVSGDGRGAVWARRVYFDGSFGGPFPSVAFNVSITDNAVFPVTTSASNVDLELTGMRYFTVAYPRIFGTGADTQSSIYSNVTTFGDESGTRQSITSMEDIAVDDDQPECSIATDGEGFLLSYAERSAAGDYDQFLVSGGVQDRTGGLFRTALSERHQMMANTPEFEYGSVVVTRYDGGVQAGALADHGIAVWTRGANPKTSSIAGARIETFKDAAFPGDRPVGTQYCEATVNSAGRKGWMRAMAPDQSVGTNKRLIASDIAPFAFGYLLAAPNVQFVPGPGGSQGNLCVAGAGRFLDQIILSDGAGTIESVVDPMDIPQPTGAVSALPGDTWYFQLWHRDIVGTNVTSNFTNAVSLTLTP